MIKKGKKGLSLLLCTALALSGVRVPAGHAWTAEAQTTEKTRTMVKYEPAQQDSNMQVRVGENVTRNGNTLTIPYTLSGSNASAVNQISVLVLNTEYVSGNIEDDDILDYTKLSVGTLSESGTGSYTLKETLTDLRMCADYFVYVIPETVGEGETVEYAGTPKLVNWAVPAENEISIGTDGITDPKVWIDSGESWTGCFVYYGRWDSDSDGKKEPTKYRVLDVSTTDFSADGTTDTMFLDSEAFLMKGPFDYNGTATTWKDSTLRLLLNGNEFYDNETALTKAESSAIASSTKTAHALTTDSTTGVNVSSVAKNLFESSTALTGEKIFLLDAEEISNKLYGYSPNNWKFGSGTRKKGTASDYYLRSVPADTTAYTEPVIGTIESTGQFTVQYTIYNWGVCPAFNLKRSSVLFSSVAEDDNCYDKTVLLHNAGSKVTTSAGVTRKLTLRDERKKLMRTAGKSVTAASDGTITVPYTYTDTAKTQNETVNQLSVMITDQPYSAENTSHAKILYYGAVDNIKDADGNAGTAASTKKGTVEFVPPAALQGKAYYMYLIAEHVSTDDPATTNVNEGIYSDYAAEPLEIKVTKLLSEVEVPQLETPIPEQPLPTTLSSAVTKAAVSISWKKNEKAAGTMAEWNTSYQAKLTLTPAEGYAFLDSAGNRTDVIVAGSKLADNEITWNDDGTIVVDGGSYTTAARKITSVEAPQVPAQFTKKYTQEDVLSAAELQIAAKITLEGTTAPNVFGMEADWTIVDENGIPASYNTAGGAENRYKWQIKPSEYTSYDTNGIAMTGTVVIRNKEEDASAVQPEPKETPSSSTIVPKPTTPPVVSEDKPSTTNLPPVSTAASEPVNIPPTVVATLSPVPAQTPDHQENTPSPSDVTENCIKDGSGKGCYRLTQTGKNQKTVTYVRPVKTKVKKVTVPAKVKIQGVTYRVTAIAAKAFVKCKNLQEVTIGKNVTKIGKKAFYKRNKLKKLIVLTKKLTKKQVGAKVFAGTSAKLTVQVPKGKKEAYRKLFKKKGMSRKTVVI